MWSRIPFYEKSKKKQKKLHFWLSVFKGFFKNLKKHFSNPFSSPATSFPLFFHFMSCIVFYALITVQLHYVIVTWLTVSAVFWLFVPAISAVLMYRLFRLSRTAKECGQPIGTIMLSVCLSVCLSVTIRPIAKVSEQLNSEKCLPMNTILQLSTPSTDHIFSIYARPKFRNFT